MTVQSFWDRVLSLGQALLSARLLGTGTRSIYARYSGDRVFAPSVSPHFLQRVNSSTALDIRRVATASSSAGSNLLVSTLVGNAMPPTSMPATSVPLEGPGAVATDSVGNFYYADRDSVYRVDRQGIATRVAGSGTRGFSGDGGPAVLAQMNGPAGLATDAKGNLYISDSSNNRVRQVSPNGSITTFAGNGNGCCSLGDGGPATLANVGDPGGLAVDGAGNLLITEMGENRVRKVDSTGIITTLAGTGTPGYAGDGGSALNAMLKDPSALALDSSGNIFITDTWNYVIRRVSTDGTITTVAGSGSTGYTADNQPAASAKLGYPSGIAVDASGILYILDNCSVRAVGSSGLLTTIAGSRTCGFGGDGGPAIFASINSNSGLAFDSSGSLYVGDALNLRVRKISAGKISTVAGGGAGDAPAAPFGEVVLVSAMARDAAGNIFIADGPVNRVYEFAPNGAMTTIAGTGIGGYWGDNAPAVSAQLNAPNALAVDASGDLYISDSQNHRIRKVSNGIITTVAGNGGCFPANDATVTCFPQVVAVDPQGNLYFSNGFRAQVYRVASTGAILPVAGNGTQGFSGDGQAATTAELSGISALAFDVHSNLYISDAGNQRLRKISNGIITTIAGTGTTGFSGDGGPATAAQIYDPGGICVDAAGNVFFADTANGVVRKISTDGSITTVAGLYNSDWSVVTGELASDAGFEGPLGVFADAQGNLYVFDSGGRVFLLTPVNGPPLLTINSTHAGNFALGQSGQYTLTVSNTLYAGATNGTITVTEFAPAGLTISAMSGTGWSCDSSTCTRSDVLSPGYDYPAITVSVDVSQNALAQVTNRVTVGGGGAVATLGGQDLTSLSPPAITLQTSPSGLQFSIDGMPGQTGPASQNLFAGPHFITVPSPQAGASGSQYVFSNWSDSGAQSHIISVDGTPETYTAAFNTQYQLTTTVLPAGAGSAAPTAGSYFDQGSQVALTATSRSPYTFSYWSGAAFGNSNPTTLVVTAPSTVTANFVSADLNSDNKVNATDLQQIINEALGGTRAVHDLNNDGVVNIADVQRLLNTALHLY